MFSVQESTSKFCIYVLGAVCLILVAVFIGANCGNYGALIFNSRQKRVRYRGRTVPQKYRAKFIREKAAKDTAMCRNIMNSINARGGYKVFYVCK